MGDVDRGAARKKNLLLVPKSPLHHSFLCEGHDKPSTEAQTGVAIPKPSSVEFKVGYRSLVGACVIWRTSSLVVVILTDGRTLFGDLKALSTTKCASSWWVITLVPSASPALCSLAWTGNRSLIAGVRGR